MSPIHLDPMDLQVYGIERNSRHARDTRQGEGPSGLLGEPCNSIESVQARTGSYTHVCASKCGLILALKMLIVRPQVNSHFERLPNLMLTMPTTPSVSAGPILERGAGLSVVWPQFLSIAAIGGVLFTASLKRFHRTISLME